MTAQGDTRADTDCVEVLVPADARFLRLARIAASALAADAGFTVEELDDLRLAVGEACALLIEASPEHSELRLTYRVNAGRFEFTAACPASNDSMRGLDSAAAAIFAATVDDYALTDAPESNAFILVKQSAAEGT
jgi:serine/threonine-protein kinase RsbW